MTSSDGADAGLSPTALVATTVNVYAVPLTRPSSVALVAPAPTVLVAPPGAAVTVYPVTGDPLPPTFDHDTATEPSPAVTLGLPT